MTCVELTNDGETVTGYICTSRVLEIKRRVQHCPVCERRRRMVIVYPNSAWYGPRITCCGCGDSWQEGEMLERPFRRAWRKQSIAKAKQEWDNAFTLTGEQKRAWLEEQLGPIYSRDVKAVDTGGLT